MKKFTFATETILEVINEAIRNGDMSKFEVECKHAETDSYIAHIDAIDARNKAASGHETIAEYLYRWSKETLESHYEDKASLLCDIGLTLSELISQVHKLEDLNVKIEEVELDYGEQIPNNYII